MADVVALVGDLTAESDALDDLVANLTDEQWAMPTPAAGWTIAHQIGHLLWTDRTSLFSVTDPEGFSAMVAEAFASGEAEDMSTVLPRQRRSDRRPTCSWTGGRRGQNSPAHCARSPTDQALWFGPSMSASSMATAHHGDVGAWARRRADALGVTVELTERLRHVAHIGGAHPRLRLPGQWRQVPAELFRYELKSPTGADEWTGTRGRIERRPWGRPWTSVNSSRSAVIRPTDIIDATTGDDAAEWVVSVLVFRRPARNGP